jgi:hypothetical protein
MSPSVSLNPGISPCRIGQSGFPERHEFAAAALQAAGSGVNRHEVIIVV